MTCESAAAAAHPTCLAALAGRQLDQPAGTLQRVCVVQSGPTSCGGKQIPCSPTCLVVDLQRVGH
jgi:hypothetical protein